MKKFFVFLGIFLIAGTLWAVAPFQLFVGGERTKIHPIIFSDRIYIPLEEAARLFHQKADVDLTSRRIVLEPMSEQETAEAMKQDQAPPSDAILLGTTVSTLEKNVTKPIGRVKIKLFKGLPGSDIDEERRALELWITNGDSRFLDSHGLVAETASDSDGQFGFSKVPSGTYALVALAPISSTEVGYWWLPLRVQTGQTQKVNLDLKAARRLQLLRK